MGDDEKRKRSIRIVERLAKTSFSFEILPGLMPKSMT
jgi:hypothetical protein